MKKIYAILAAAFVGLGMQAAPMRALNASLPVGETLQNVVIREGSHEQLMQSLKPAYEVMPQTRQLSRADYLYPLNTNFYGTIPAFMKRKNSTLNAYQPMMTYVDFVKGEEEGEVIVKDFLYNYFIDIDTVYDVKAKLGYYEFDDGEGGLYGGWVLTMPAGAVYSGPDDEKGEPKTPICQVEGEDMYLYYMAEGEPGTWYYYTRYDVSFLIGKDGTMEEVILVTEEDAADEGDEPGIYVIQQQGSLTAGVYAINKAVTMGINFFDVQLQLPNGVQTYYDYDSEGPDGAGFYGPYIEPIWTWPYSEIDDDGNPIYALFMRGFAGMPDPIFFMVDPEENLGTAFDQATVSIDGYGDFVLTSDFGSETSAPTDFMLDMEIGTNDEGNTTLKILGDGQYNEFWAYCVGKGYWSLNCDMTIELNYNIFTGNPTQGGGDDSGVSSVAADAVSAPVYYNLQGVQVARPEAGHIYIVKEGSKISKRIIR